MKKAAAAILIIFAFACMAHAAGDAFDGADLNKDGKIDKNEFDRAVEKKFREHDKNGDGVLDRSEMRELQKAHPKADVAKEFEKMDRNKDGVVDLKEFKEEAAKRFQEYDRNGDGVLDRPELDYRGRYQDPDSAARPFGGFYF